MARPFLSRSDSAAIALDDTLGYEQVASYVAGVRRLRAAADKHPIGALANQASILEGAKNRATKVRVQACQPSSLNDRQLCAWDLREGRPEPLKRAFDFCCLWHG